MQFFLKKSFSDLLIDFIAQTITHLVDEIIRQLAYKTLLLIKLGKKILRLLLDTSLKDFIEVYSRFQEHLDDKGVATSYEVLFVFSIVPLYAFLRHGYLKHGYKITLVHFYGTMVFLIIAVYTSYLKGEVDHRDYLMLWYFYNFFLVLRYPIFWIDFQEIEEYPAKQMKFDLEWSRPEQLRAEALILSRSFL